MCGAAGRHADAQAEPTERKVLVLVGPTASGKTIVSLLLAERLDGEIISADSRQIYRHMNIGTAKVAFEDRQKIRHYFVDEFEPDVDFNAGEFGKWGRKRIDDILSRCKLPIVVGGSGLYVQALVDGFFDVPAADPSIREGLYRRAHDEGNKKLLEELRHIDPEAARRMVPGNIRRIVRALEVFHITGTPISQHQKKHVGSSFLPVFCGLRWDRAALYRRIDARVDRMIDEGLIEEVQELGRLGFSSQLNAMQTVGYKETFESLKAGLPFDSMVERIKMNSRRYAKRQLTWFSKDRRIKWFDVHEETDLPGVASKIQEYFVSMYH